MPSRFFARGSAAASVEARMLTPCSARARLTRGQLGFTATLPASTIERKGRKPRKENLLLRVSAFCVPTSPAVTTITV
ncbi:MAG: hypothetical protein DMF95_27590 [Acidobacteria bacterium]|nr:MAG: hypothetical protein DMF95_27590 [Acidobacteriota bacterium]